MQTRVIRVMAVLLLSGIIGIPVLAGTRYVTPTGAGAQNGTDWANAYSSIQTAIVNSPNAGDIIYLKSGAYSLVAQLAVSNHPGLIFKGGYQGLTGTPGVLTNVASVVKRDGAVTYLCLGRVYASTVAVERVTLADGKHNAADGGAFRVESGSSLALRDCIVSNHNLIQGGSRYGAAIYMTGGGSLDIRNSQFVNNRITGGWWWEQGYGGAIACVNADVVVSNVQFHGNYISTRSGYERGGSLYLSGGQAVLTDNVWSNSIAASQYVHDYPSCYSWGGALYALDVAPLIIVSNTFTKCSTKLTDGSAVEFGDALCLDGASIQARITGCMMTANGVTTGSRNLYVKQGTVCLDRVTVANGKGAGIFQAGGTLTATNLLVYGQTGHGFRGGGGSANLSHATIVRNAGSGVTNTVGTVSLTNSIVYWHPNTTYVREQQTNNIAGSGVTAAYTCSYPPPAGTGNIGDDPEFVSVSLSDYRLRMGSACVDAGFNPGAGVDLDGRIRPQDGDGAGGAQYDLGAYELTNVAAGVLRCDFVSSTNQGWGSVTAVLTAHVAGSNTNIVWYGWDFNSDGTWDVEGVGRGIVTNTFSTPDWYDVTLRVTNDVSAYAVTTRVDYIMVLTNIFHVAPDGGHQSPYSTWATAATNLKAALDVAYPGAVVLLTNATFTLKPPVNVTNAVIIRGRNGAAGTILDINASSGDRRRGFYVTVAGAVIEGLTFKRGYSATSGTDSYGGAIYQTANSLIRDCVFTNNIAVFGSAVFMTAGMVSNCLFRNNAANDLGGGGSSGRGALYLAGGVAENCTISSNTATRGGGGICMTAATVRRSTITHNTAGHGGGGISMEGVGLVENSLLFKNSGGSYNGGGGGIFMNTAGSRILNCTLADNRTTGLGGGIYHSAGSISNSIIYYNTLTESGADNDLYSTNLVRYSCAPELATGTGNLLGVPDFVDRVNRDYQLAAGSICRDSGANLATITLDRDGNPRPLDGDGDSVAVHDLGAFEAPASDGGPLRCGFSAPVTDALGSLAAVFTATLEGEHTDSVTYRWDFNNDGTFDRTGTQYPVVTNVYSPGRYTVRLVVSNDLNEVTNVTRVSYLRVSPTDLYVWTGGGNTLPYADWTQAANTIADAIDLAYHGSTIWVTNGTYGVTEQLNLIKGVTLRSVNGKLVTFLERTSGTIRVIGINHADAVLDGFTVRKGAATSMNGGGANLVAGLILNCTFTNNAAAYGGGVYASGGVISNCYFTKNVVSGSGGQGQGGGLYLAGSALGVQCTVYSNTSGRTGAGVRIAGGTLRQSTIRGNTDGWGGSLSLTGGRAESCLVVGNKANADSVAGVGGGGVTINAANAVVVNCTVVRNYNAGVTKGGGGLYINAGSATNCIIYNNASAIGNANVEATTIGKCAYSCSPDLSSGTGNITSDPIFKDPGSGSGLAHVLGDYDLDPASPCANQGINQAWMNGQRDLKGAVRWLGSAVDMGAYETPMTGGSLFLFR